MKNLTSGDIIILAAMFCFTLVFLAIIFGVIFECYMDSKEKFNKYKNDIT